jgi:MFS transporter, FSR family, fosmidomycin resistance protein
MVTGWTPPSPWPRGCRVCGVAVTLRPRVALIGAPLAFLITGAHLANDAFSNVLPVYLPTLQQRFGFGEVALASLVALIALSANVMQAFMGALTDRWGRRRAAAFGLLLSSVLMSFVVVAPTVWALVAMLAVGGLGSAIFHPGAVAMMRDVGGRQRLTLAVGLFAAGGALGSAIMPVVALAILRVYGAAYVPWLALVGVTLSVALFMWAPVSTPLRGTARPKLFDATLFAGPVGLLSLAGTMRATAFVSFTSAMPLYLVNVRGFAPDAAVIGATLATYGVASAAGGMLSGLIERQVGRVRLVVVSMLLAAPALTLVLALTPETPAYYAVIALAALLTNASVPVLVVSAQDLAPHAVGTASGMLMGLTWGTAGVAYIGFGAIQELVGLVPALIASFAFLLPAAALAGAVLVRTRERWSA